MVKYLQLILIFIALQLQLSAQNKYLVSVTNVSFTPANLVITQGDTVQWTNVAGFHNVNGTSTTYPSNPESFTNGAASNTAWTYSKVFNITGSYDYVCDIHAPNMAGVITVNPVVLPIELIYFTTNVTKGIAYIEWKTENETKVAAFELEKSNNAKTFETIKYVQANKSPSLYSYFDKMELANLRYYRLKIINEDNSIQYSPVRLVYSDIKVKEDNIVVTPNPSSTHFHAIINAKQKYNGDIIVYDMFGQQVYTKPSITLEEGTNTVHLEKTSLLPNGIYIIAVRNTKTDKQIAAQASKF